jgi:hypothetical protein
VVYVRPTLEERFWAKVLCEVATGCCLWTGGERGAYGNFWCGYDRGYRYAHQVAYELQHGPIPADKLVCHSCHRNLCVRGDHLYAGTDQSNSDDKVRAGRHAHGESHGHAKLTEADVRDIRRKYAIPGVTQTQLAAEFHVSFQTISMITTRKVWKHVK